MGSTKLATKRQRKITRKTRKGHETRPAVSLVEALIEEDARLVVDGRR
jgi:hypothetical protein